MKWSKTRLKCFRLCPYCYKLKYIDEVKGEDAGITIRGRLLHEAFDKFYKLYDEERSLEENMEVALNNVEGIDDEFVKKYAEHIDAFLDFNKKKIEEIGIEDFTPLYTEIELEDEKWKGIIDRIDKVGDNIIVIDYKTSKGYNLDKYYDELCLYAYLVMKKLNLKVNYVGVFFTGNNKFVLKKVTEEEVMEVVDSLNAERLSYEFAIKNGNFPKRRGWWCKAFCPYYKICMQEGDNNESEGN